MSDTAPARVVLLAGASGTGKSTLARRTGLPVVTLDDFYRAADGSCPRSVTLPPMPRRFGTIDWDHPDSWDGDGALVALRRLCQNGSMRVPRYDIAASAIVGHRDLHLAGAPLLLAEGVFAAQLIAPLREAGLLADALCLRLPPPVTFARRLARDLAGARKPPATLVRRGLGLARQERALTRSWVASGCTPVTPATARRRIATLADDLSGPSAARVLRG